MSFSFVSVSFPLKKFDVHFPCKKTILQKKLQNLFLQGEPLRFPIKFFYSSVYNFE